MVLPSKTRYPSSMRFRSSCCRQPATSSCILLPRRHLFSTVMTYRSSLALICLLGVLALSAPHTEARRAPRQAPGRVSPPVRLSGDLLRPSGAAEPETQTEPYLAVNPNDFANLVAVYQDNRFANGGARALTCATTRDAGATWSEQIVPKLTQATDGPWDRASDPWVAFGPNGRVYFVSLLFSESRPDNAVAV